MSNKILIAVAPAILLASTGLASAKTQTHWRAPYAYDCAVRHDRFRDRNLQNLL
jgi:hypothetical protein